MKKQDRLKLLAYAKGQYIEFFGLDYKFKRLSKKDLYNLLKQNKHSSMYEWSYCCYGLCENCWEEIYEEGNWMLSQNEIDKIIKSTIDSTAKICRRDSRILYCEKDNCIYVVIIARDVVKADYLICFTNERF